VWTCRDEVVGVFVRFSIAPASPTIDKINPGESIVIDMFLMTKPQKWLKFIGREYYN
jgi:hypothetical protein